MNYRIHIFGASGSGTSSVGLALANRLKIPHFDTDDFFWQKTAVPFSEKRPAAQRIERLQPLLENSDSWVLSGSLCGWGDFTIPLFTLAVFLFAPVELRLQRLAIRETSRYGLSAISPGGWFYQHHQEFMDWNRKYDTAGTEIRSRALHEQWIKQLTCKLLRIEGALSIQETTDLIIRTLN